MQLIALSWSWEGQEYLSKTILMLLTLSILWSSTCHIKFTVCYQRHLSPRCDHLWKGGRKKIERRRRSPRQTLCCSFKLPSHLHLENLPELEIMDRELKASGKGDNLSQMGAWHDGSITWDFIPWIRTQTSLPIFIKVQVYISALWKSAFKESVSREAAASFCFFVWQYCISTCSSYSPANGTFNDMPCHTDRIRSILSKLLSCHCKDTF